MSRQLLKDFYRMFILWYPARLPDAPQRGGARP